jgi:hypothetical protein
MGRMTKTRIAIYAILASKRNSEANKEEEAIPFHASTKL